MLRADVNGVTLYSEEAGTGPPLLLIHTFSARGGDGATEACA